MWKIDSKYNLFKLFIFSFIASQMVLITVENPNKNLLGAKLTPNFRTTRVKLEFFSR